VEALVVWVAIRVRMAQVENILAAQVVVIPQESVEQEARVVFRVQVDRFMSLLWM
jgi:hypothetical protein